MLWPSVCLQVFKNLEENIRLREEVLQQSRGNIMDLPLRGRRYYNNFAADIHEDDFDPLLAIELTLVNVVGHLVVETVRPRATSYHYELP